MSVVNTPSVLVYVFVLVVPTLVSAATAIVLSRPGIGIFTTEKTRTNAIGTAQYQFKSSTYRRLFGFVIASEFFALFLCTLYVADTYLVGL